MSGSLISEQAKALKPSALRNFDVAHRNSRTANTKHSNIKKQLSKIGQRWLVISLAFTKSRKDIQAFPEQKKSSNRGVGLCHALKTQVIESGRIFNTDDYHSSN